MSEEEFTYNHDEEEYHFADEEAASAAEKPHKDEKPAAEQQAPAKQTAGAGKLAALKAKLSSLQRKHIILIVVIVIIVLYGLFSFVMKKEHEHELMMGDQSQQNHASDLMGGFAAKSQQSAAPAASSQQQDLGLSALSNNKPSAVHQPPMQQMKSMPSVAADQQSAASKEQMAKLGARMAQIEAQNRRMMAIIHEQAASRMANVQADQSDNSSKLQALSTQVSALQMMIKTLNDRLSDVQKQQAARPRISHAQAQALPHTLSVPTHQLHKTHAAAPKASTYFVEAVIPGRAWLQTQDGETVTVAVGDTLKGFGKIVAINPYSGDVMTSSGKTLKYGVGEN